MCRYVKAGGFPAFTLRSDVDGDERMSDRIQEIREKVRDAQMVLIGIGEAFQYDWSALLQDTRYQEIEREIGDDEKYIWIMPFLQKMILLQAREDRWKKAYAGLAELAGGKNYFIVSLCMDDRIYEAGLEEQRIVTPCGGFRKMQCDNNCSGELTDMPQEVYEAVVRYYRGEVPLSALCEPTCEACGNKRRFNQLGVSRYAEEGYLRQWDAYTKWLQGTVNRKLCVLELGVGLEYPNIIRFPFEKIVFYNQKAFMYRIHPVVWQLGEEIGDRGIGIKEDPVDFLIKGFVK